MGNLCQIYVLIQTKERTWKVPSIPLLDAHGVSVDLLIQLIEKADSLNYHGVDLIGGELELVTGERMGQAKLHGAKVSTTYTSGVITAGLHELVHVAADATEQLGGLGVVDDAARELIFDAGGQCLISDGEAFCPLLFELLLEKGFKRLVHLSLNTSGGGRNGVGGVRKGLEGHEVEHRLGFVLIREEFVIHIVGIGLFQLLLIRYLLAERQSRGGQGAVNSLVRDVGHGERRGKEFVNIKVSTSCKMKFKIHQRCRRTAKFHVCNDDAPNKSQPAHNESSKAVGCTSKFRGSPHSSACQICHVIAGYAPERASNPPGSRKGQA